MELLEEKLTDFLKIKAEEMEKQINMVHMEHIHDFEAIKNVTREFVLTRDRLDQKIQLVVDIERQYQLLLHHMRKTSRIVDQLVEFNISAIQQMESRH